MIKGKYYLILLGIILVSAIALRISSLFNVKPDNNIKVEPTESFVLEGADENNLVATNTVVSTQPKSMTDQEAVIFSPQSLSIVSSPLIVSGQAKGSWFFEGSLPVKLVDESDNVIAVTPAQAEGDWMTSNFVPFKALLDFTSTSTTGYLVVSKDNPSGLPEFDDSIRIPLRFLTK